MEFINIIESSSIFSFKYSSPRCLNMHSWYKYNYQSNLPPSSLRSSYQPPFLLQLPWIALSQDCCQYSDHMIAWLTKLNSWQVHRFVSSESIQASGDLPSLTCHPAGTTHLLPWTKADRTRSRSLTYIQHQSQKSMELYISHHLHDFVVKLLLTF
jgi:hypothetical protein